MSNPHPQFLSRVSGNPIKKKQIYFTCPITERFKYGKVYGKEVINGTQDFRDKVRKVLGWAIKDGLINAEEHNTLLEEGYEHIKKAEQEERNKPLLNPEWVAWNEENRPTKTTTKKTKDENPNNCPRHLQLERKNKELTEQLEQMKELITNAQKEIEEVDKKNKELKEENHALLERIMNQKKLYTDLLNKKPEPEPEQPKPKKTNKGKKYKTKNTIIDEVIDEVVNEVVNEDDEPIDL